LARHSLSPQSLSLPDVNSLSPRFFQFRPRQDPRPVPFDSPRRPEQALPVFPVGNQALRPRARLVRTGTVPPSRRRLRRPNSVIENHVGRRARTRGRGQRWGPNPPPPSPSPPPSPPVPSPPPSPPAGDNPLDMRHVLSQFTRTMATALRGRRGTESSEIKRVKELGAKEFVGSTDPAEAELWITDVERIFE
ncbi:Leucine-rich repeat extensin-like protein 6, partial [Prunus dulcis]